MAELFLANLRDVHGEDGIKRLGHRTDRRTWATWSHIMPALHPSMAGATGTNHATDWDIVDSHMAYVEPAKALAWMAVDLLGDDAGAARRIVNEFEPLMTRDEYLAYQRGVMREERWALDG